MILTGLLEIVLSKPLPSEAFDEVAKLVEFLNKDYLKRGARKPEDAATITKYNIELNVIKMRIETGTKVRLDEASLRVKNVLASSLGSKYHIGIRKLTLRDVKVIMDTKISISLRLPFIKGISEANGKTVIEFSELHEDDLKKPIFLRLMQLIEEKEKRVKWGGKAEHWMLLKASAPRIQKPIAVDPNKILEEIGWMKRMSIGQWLYTPPLTHLLNALKKLFLDEVVKPLGFQEATFPKMYPLEVGLKTGHLKGVINSIIFASLPKSYELSEFEELIDSMYVMDSIDPEDLQRYLKPSTYFLCFAQCEPFYWFFESEILDDSTLPVKWFDMSGPSFRWESGGIHGIERVIEFHRIEVVWLGKPEHVIDTRNKLLERYEYFMDKVLELEWRMAWVTPWFYEQSGTVQEEVRSVNIDVPGTIDFEAWLPYRGSREDNKNWLEIGNISIHGTKFTEPFRVKHNKGDTLWTGCSGFGSERWLIALLAQKGFDVDEWPKKILEYVKATPFPQSIMTVSYPKTKEGKELLNQITSKLVW
jgi:seryl-tRNA synthetase